MYLSILFIALSIVSANPKAIMLIVWLILLVNLIIKMNIEELNLIKTFPAYIKYKSKTKRLIPFFY